MSITIDRFKNAFFGQASPNLLENRRKKCAEALQVLKEAVETLEATGADVGSFRADFNTLLVRLSNIMKSSATVSVKYEDLEDVKVTARQKARECQRSALTADETQSGAGKVMAQCRVAKKSSADLLKMCKSEQSTDPQFLSKLLKLDGGKDVLDSIIAGLGRKVSSKGDQDFITNAMKLRYGLDVLEGDLGARTLPALYRAMNLVPESHVAENLQIDTLKYNAESGSSDWVGRKITLNIDAVDETSELKPDDADGVKDEWKPDPTPVNYFDHTTLHEIGHGVDAKKGFMRSRSGNENFGGWTRVTKEEIVDRVGRKMNFFKDFEDTYPLRVLQMALSDAMDGLTTSPSWSDAVTQESLLPEKDDFLNNPGVKFLDQCVTSRNENDNWDSPFNDTENALAMSRIAKESDTFADVINQLMSKMVDQKQTCAQIIDPILAKAGSIAPSKIDILNDPGIQYLDRRITSRNENDNWNDPLYDETSAKMRTTGPLRKNPSLQKVLTQLFKRMIRERKTADAVIDGVLREIQDVVPVPTGSTWDEIVNHRAYQWCLPLKMSERWNQGNAGAQASKLDDLVYTSDKSGWYAYSYSARKKAVTNYQFNTPAEWFAELYAAYYTQRLPESHPDYAWISSLIDETPRS